jgi:hypothetical protein
MTEKPNPIEESFAATWKTIEERNLFLDHAIHYIEENLKENP